MRRLLVFLSLVSCGSLWAAGYQGQPQNIQWRDMVLNLSYEVDNHEVELQALKRRLEDQEHITDTVRREAERLQMLARELLKSQSEAVSGQLASVEGGHGRLRHDIEQLQAYASTVNEHLASYHNRLQALEVALQQQNKNLATLETAVRSLVDVLHPTGGDKSSVTADASESILYRVADGDSLGTIAKKHHTTIKKIKEANNLTGDRIITGQKLKIPPPDVQSAIPANVQ